jgi:hydroxymethylpyrimidine pyrophosphatase-like HAD family hydrolase
VTPSFDSLLATVSKIVAVSDDYGLVKSTDSELQSALGKKASVSRSQPYYIDVTHPLANKAEVVEYHTRRLGLSANAVCTLGDGPNDVLMFERSGYSIAMGNASDEVKARATAVTESYDSEGFAKALERFLL